MPVHHFKLLKTLTDHGVPVVVIGGHAVSFHGHIRDTEDLDVVWLRSEAAEAALLAALSTVNARWISNEIDPATGIEKLRPVSLPYIQANHLMMLVTDLGLLDLFDYVPGIPDANAQDVFDQSIPSGDARFVSLDWLRRMKRATDRSKDAEDLRQLEEQ
jgi:hypothetical protein